MAKLAEIDFDEVIVAPDDADARAEILLLSPSILVPCLTYQGHAGVGHAGDRRVSERDRAEGGPSAQGSGNARPLPLDLRRDAFGLRLAEAGAADEHQGRHSPDFKIWSKAKGDIERIKAIWRECLEAYGGPYLFGKIGMADAMYAPVVSRFRTYGVELDGELKAYADRIWDWPAMQEWREAALAEKEEIEELEVEF